MEKFRAWLINITLISWSLTSKETSTLPRSLCTFLSHLVLSYCAQQVSPQSLYSIMNHPPFPFASHDVFILCFVKKNGNHKP